MKENRITVNYSEAMFLVAAITRYMRDYPIDPARDWPDADIDYLIGQLQEAVENLGGDY